MQGYLIETFVTLVAVCGLAVALLWGAKRMGVGRASGPIELCGHLPLDGRRSIYLVKVGDHVFVVAAGEGGFTKLGELPATALPPRGAPSATAFGDVLARALGRPDRRVADAVVGSGAVIGAGGVGPAGVDASTGGKDEP